MGEVISVIALFDRRVTGDDVEADSSIHQRRKRIQLLDECRWQRETGTVCDNELYALSRTSENGRQKNRIRLGGADIGQQTGNPAFLGLTAELNLTLKIR